MSKSKFLRIMSLILAVLMTVTMMSGCGEAEYEEIISYIDVPAEDSDDVSTDASSTDNTSDIVSSNVSGDSSSNNTANNSGSSQSTSGSVNPADYKGTSIVYAVWDRAEGIDTDAVIAKFKQKYGISVEIKKVGQDNYIQSITGLIASGNAPDVIKDCSEGPTFLTIAQPLQNAKIDLTDPIWDQNKIKKSTINGKTYSISSLGPIFNYINVCFYNKKLLQQNGIKTPEDYQKIGQWNLNAVEKIARDTVALGSQYSGFYADKFGYFIPESLGYNFFTFDSGKFTLMNLSDATFIKIAQKISTWENDGLRASARERFNEGKCALAFLSSYGALKSGYWYNMKSNWKDIGIIDMPAFEDKSSVRTQEWNGYGICEGAKNPIAAGLFLRYYLDCNNYDLENEFISSEVLNFVQKRTSESYNGPLEVYSGVYSALGYSSRDKYYYELMATDSAQIQSLLKSLEPVLKNDVNNLNSYVDKQIKAKK